MIIDRFKIYMHSQIVLTKILYTKKIGTAHSHSDFYTISQNKISALLHQNKSNLSSPNESYLLRNTYHIHDQRNQLLDILLSQPVLELFIIHFTAFFREASIIIPRPIYRYRNKEWFDIFLFK